MISGYLRKSWGESRKRKVIKLGNEIRESKYSKNEQKKKWRLCKTEVQTWRHVWEKCRKWRKEQCG